MLAPNKQNLLLLKAQQKTVRNGYKLLKEKQTGLIITFLDLARQGKQLESQLQSQLNSILYSYRQSMVFVSSQSLLESLTPEPALDLKVSRRRISGVYTEKLEVFISPPKRNHLKPEISDSLHGFSHTFPVILELSQTKLNCRRLAKEIQKVNRQLANLDDKLQNIAHNIKHINDTLNEKANLEKAVLIRLFG